MAFIYCKGTLFFCVEAFLNIDHTSICGLFNIKQDKMTVRLNM